MNILFARNELAILLQAVCDTKNGFTDKGEIIWYVYGRSRKTLSLRRASQTEWTAVFYAHREPVMNIQRITFVCDRSSDLCLSSTTADVTSSCCVQTCICVWTMN